MAHTELGRRILDRLVTDLDDSAVVEASPKQDGRNMVMVIAPTKKQPGGQAGAERPRLRRTEARAASPSQRKGSSSRLAGSEQGSDMAEA